MPTYEPAKTFSPLIYIILVVLASIVTILLTNVQVGIVVASVGLITILVVYVIVNTILRNQYNVKLTIDQKYITVRNNDQTRTYHTNDVQEFTFRSPSRGPPNHVTIKLVNGETIKIFTPDAKIIEGDLKKILQQKGKKVNRKDIFWPIKGPIKYTVEKK